MSRPTIAVLGTLTRDTTTYADGRRTENLGGLVYTLSTLAHLFAGGARILPVANVGVDLFPRVQEALAELPGVETTHLRTVQQPNNHVHLTYLDDARRDEVLEGLVPPVATEHALAARDADHYLVNLTSGRDVELATMQALRAEFRGTIQFDIHSLTLDIEPGGWRVLRRPERWRDWLACADWVQMNETEARLLGDREPPERFAPRLLELGPRVVLVTLGHDGAFGCWREPAGLETLRLSAAARPRPAFPTGCGDVFGAAFAYARLNGAGVAAALAFANGVAGAKASLEPQSELGRIRRHAARYLQELTAVIS
jgi:sugar/nucleoside kinase (ribokinase family)